MADLVLNAMRRNLVMAERAGNKARAERLRKMIGKREAEEKEWAAFEAGSQASPPVEEAAPAEPGPAEPPAPIESEPEVAEPVFFTASAALDEAVDKPAPKPRTRRAKAEAPEESTQDDNEEVTD